MREGAERYQGLTGFPTAEDMPPWPFSNIIDMTVWPHWMVECFSDERKRDGNVKSADGVIAAGLRILTLAYFKKGTSK